MRDNPRTTAVSVALGVVLLGAVFAFAVLVPELDDTEPASESTTEAEPAPSGPITLPDELTGGLVAVDLGTLPPELLQQFGDPAALAEQEASIADGLEELYGVPGAFRLYASVEGPSLAQVTVLDRAPGLFIEALPVDPEVIGVARPSSELVRVGDAVCSVNWGEDVPVGQPVDPAAPPQGVRCQLDAGERTFEVTSQGLTLDQVTAVLDDLAQV